MAALPEDPDVIGQDWWSNSSPFRRMVRTPEPIFSDILEEEVGGPAIVVAAVPIVGERGEFLGALVGKFGLAETAVSSFYATIVKLRPAQSSRTYLVDTSGRVIFHYRADQIGADFSAQPVVRQVLRGDVGVIRTEDLDGADIVAGFAPVPGTPWALVTEESWNVLTGGSRGYQRFLILLLVLGAAVPILFVVIGLRRIMRPLEDLVGAAREVARGDFGRTIAAKSGDEIGQLVGEFNTMAAQLKESYTSLEQKVEERTEELRQSEERYRAVFEQSRDAIFIAQDGVVVDTNQAALDLFGFTREGAIGSKVGDRYADPSDRGRFREEISKHGSIMDFEVKLLKHDGTVMDCLLTASGQDDVNGAGVRRIQGVVRDITAHNIADRALRQYSEDLARSNSDLQQFAYVASHGLQEPLRMVSSYTQMLARRYKDRLDADADEFIGYAVDGATRMQTLINDLLAYSRLGTPEASFEAVDCNSLLGQVEADLRSNVEESGAEISYTNLPTVNADRSQLAQVFQNLIGNAIKFRGEEPPRIQVSGGRLGAEWLFSVSDNGIGIEPKYADRVFVIFQRLGTREQYPGTGIGLAICKRIVENHGGRIWFESEQGKGTTFFFSIPVAEDV